jgi:hypothetical protein
MFTLSSSDLSSREISGDFVQGGQENVNLDLPWRMKS